MPHFSLRPENCCAYPSPLHARTQTDLPRSTANSDSAPFILILEELCVRYVGLLQRVHVENLQLLQHLLPTQRRSLRIGFSSVNSCLTRSSRELVRFRSDRLPRTFSSTIKWAFGSALLSTCATSILQTRAVKTIYSALCRITDSCLC